MVDKLVDSTGLDRLAKGLDNRSKLRDQALQSAVDNRVVKPNTNGTQGQILSVLDDGSTQWIDNVEAISKEYLDDMWDEIFTDEEEVEEGYIDVKQLKLISKSDIDDIMEHVFTSTSDQ